MTRNLPLLLVLLVTMWNAATLSAGNETYYSKVTATAKTGEGKVYVSLEKKTPAETDYSEASENKQSAQTASHTYYLYAQPAEGMILSHWTKDGATVSSSNPAIINLNATSKDEASPTVANYVANFILRPAVTLTNMMPQAADATITPIENRIGQTVTLKSTIKRITAYNCRNIMIEFVGWADSNGNILSTEPQYSFTVTEPIDITAVYRNKSSLKAAGYYRIRNIFNRVLTIEGNYKYQSVGMTENYLDGLLRWSAPDDLVESDFAGKKWTISDNPRVDVESLPSTVIYLEGDLKNINAGPDEDAVTNVVAYGQGTNTETMTGRKLTIKPSLGTWCGYHILYGSLSAGFKMTNREAVGLCSALLGNCKYDDPFSAMALQAIDEEHFDDFWFGAAASENMEFEGGYWTSMYTGFPYECRDGVEAYYATETVEADGRHYVRLTQIESGVVPANSAVLLKCQGLRSRENRLMPLDFRTQLPPLEGNLLTGLFQLYTDKNLSGLVKYDPESMRVLSCDADGNVGFYRLAAADDGTYPDMLPNKAYLDLTKMSTRAPALRITTRDMSGIEDVSVDRADDTADDTVYDLYGRRVSHPSPNTLYIVNGRKVLWR